LLGDGLVSAAKSVAMNTGQLCEAANDAVQGKADREKVIAARGVSASTVSTEQNSDSQNRLKATNQLVEAEKSLAFEDTEKVNYLFLFYFILFLFLFIVYFSSSLFQIYIIIFFEKKNCFNYTLFFCNKFQIFFFLCLYLKSF